MHAAADFEPRRRSIPLPGRGGTMAALEFGPQDRPIDIVFAHANGFNARTYRAILAPLQDLRIVAPDLRGHGSTALPTSTDGRGSWRDLIDDHLALLDRLEVEDVVLAGHSMGGTVSLMAAALVPDRVRRLVLFDPVIPAAASRAKADQMAANASKRRTTFPSRDAVVETYRGRGAFATWSEAALVDYVSGGFKDLPDGQVEMACAPAWEASNYAAQGHDPWPAFFDAACPIDILRAEDGTTCSVDDRLEELTATGKISVRTVPGTTHFLPIERPDVVQAALSAATR